MNEKHLRTPEPADSVRTAPERARRIEHAWEAVTCELLRNMQDWSAEALAPEQQPPQDRTRIYFDRREKLDYM